MSFVVPSSIRLFLNRSLYSSASCYCSDADLRGHMMSAAREHHVHVRLPLSYQQLMRTMISQPRYLLYPQRVPDQNARGFLSLGRSRPSRSILTLRLERIPVVSIAGLFPGRNNMERLIIFPLLSL